MRSGEPIATLDVSLTELEALCRKATRGVGYPWGLVEEAGRAARELVAAGHDGAEALLVLLRACDARPGSTPGVLHDGVKAIGDQACPISTAAALSDRAHRVKAPVTITRVLVPLLMVPTLRRASLGIEDECPAIDRVPHDVRVVRIAEGSGTSAGAARPRVPAPVWHALQRRAHRTYVPASDASRARAGEAAGPE